MIRRGIGEKKRAFLERLHRSAVSPVTADDAAEALGLDVAEARLLLRELARAGWLSRIRQGLYALVPLGATEPTEWREDPWVVANKLWAPCYVGGWTALEHWDLTEQLFRNLVVFTATAVRETWPEIQGVRFRLRRVKNESLFGLAPVWRERTRVDVSDPSRTLADVLGEPTLGGGARHVADCVTTYMQSEHRDDRLLIDYLDRLGNMAACKRLGYFIEALELDAGQLATSCLERRSAGLSKLDPAITAKGRIAKRWGLRVNARIRREEP